MQKRKKTVNKKKITKIPKLTERQKMVWNYVIHTIDKHGYPPTLREIGDHMNIRSTNGVNDHLKALERKGYLKKGNLRARALTPLFPKGKKKGQTKANGKTKAKAHEMIQISVLGKVAAGQPIARLEHSENTFHFDPQLIGSPNEKVFALQVTGNSMIDDGIQEGDYLFVRRQAIADNGDIVVFVLDNEVTVKRFYKESDHIRLQPANEALQPIILSQNEWQETEIVGVSVGLYRKY